jgi:hypothetical protein
VEVHGVTIDPLRPEEDLQVAEEMADDKQDQDYSGRGHNHLSSDGRAMKGGDIGHKQRRENATIYRRGGF